MSHVGRSEDQWSHFLEAHKDEHSVGGEADILSGVEHGYLTNKPRHSVQGISDPPRHTHVSI